MAIKDPSITNVKKESLVDFANLEGVTSKTPHQEQTIRLECLKIAVTLLEDYIKESTLSPRDDSMKIIWEVADKCFNYCLNDTTGE